MSGERVKLRIRFAKLGKVRWTSHRDVARMWERAFRRVGLPLAYSEGFSPRPKVSFGLALPTGHESVAEFLDVELTGAAPADLTARLSEALPVGVDATAVAVLGPGIPSLQEAVTSCTWRWMAVPAGGEPAVEPDAMAARVATLLATSTAEITRTRKGSPVTEDVRPGIRGLAVVGCTPEGVVLEAELAAQPRAVRPADVLVALGSGLEERDVRRTHQWIERDGARGEPLSAPESALMAPHVLERAS